eukprot:m.131534 g.131534  ORF g.131534 m.131534 type:complete len:1022 (+) comp14793_c0_seq7:45-3110(+)
MLLALLLLTGIAGARAGLCDSPYNSSASQEIADYVLGSAGAEMKGLLACTYNSSELFYDMFCGTQSSCTGVGEYAACAAAAVANLSANSSTAPLTLALGILSARGFNDALNCTVALPSILTDVDGYRRPAGAGAVTPFSFQGINDTCTLLAGSNLYSVIVLSGVARTHAGVFGDASSNVELRATICPLIWNAPTCNGNPGVALCQQTDVAGFGTFETSFGSTLIDAYTTSTPPTLTLVYEDVLRPPTLAPLTDALGSLPPSVVSRGMDAYMGLVTNSYVQSWLGAAQQIVTVRGYVHLVCDPSVTGEPVLSNILPVRTEGLSEVRHVSIVHRCACANASCEFATDPLPLDCSDFDDSLPDEFFYAALALIGVLILVEKRKFRSDVCYGRGGVPIPFNFLEDRSHTISTAFIFCATSVLLYNFVMNPPSAPSPYLKTLYTLGFSLREALILFPLFLCNTCRIPWLGCLLGLAFSLSLAVFFALGLHCFTRQDDPTRSLTPFYVEAFVAFSLALYFGGHFTTEILARFGRASRVKTPISKTDTPTQLSHLAFYESHVKRLLTPAANCTAAAAPAGKTVGARVYYAVRQWLETFYVRWVLRKDSFRFGGRLVSATGICLLFLMVILSGGVELLRVMKMFLEAILYSGSDATCRNYDRVAFTAQIQAGFGFGLGCRVNELLINSVSACIATALAVAAIVQLASLYFVSVSYENQLLRLHRGDTRFLPEAQPDSATVVVNAVRFTGFFIGYFLTGCFAVFLVVLLVALAITGLMVLPLYGLYGTFIWSFLAQQIPIIAIGIAFFFVQILVIRHIFLSRSNQKDLSLKHRNFFHNYEYFFLIFNIISGIVSYVLRFVLFGLLAVITFSRLDKSFFIQGFEWSDPGYRTYISCLLVDAYYSNPILITFVRCLIEKPDNKLSVSDTNTDTVTDTDHAHTDLAMHLLVADSLQHSLGSDVYTAGFRRARARWQLAYTLMHNPRLVADRRALSHGKSRWHVTPEEAAELPRTPPPPAAADITVHTLPKLAW